MAPQLVGAERTEHEGAVRAHPAQRVAARRHRLLLLLVGQLFGLGRARGEFAHHAPAHRGGRGRGPGGGPPLRVSAFGQRARVARPALDDGARGVCVLDERGRLGMGAEAGRRSGAGLERALAMRPMVFAKIWSSWVVGLRLVVVFAGCLTG